MAQHDMDTADQEQAYWEAKAEAAEAEGSLDAAGLADLFGVDSPDDISDGLHDDYLAYMADLEADRLEQDTAHFHGGRDDY